MWVFDWKTDEYGWPTKTKARFGSLANVVVWSADDDRGHGREDLWKWTGIGAGYMVSVFVGCGKEPDGRRLTRPKREESARNRDHSSLTGKSTMIERHVFRFNIIVVILVFSYASDLRVPRSYQEAMRTEHAL